MIPLIESSVTRNKITLCPRLCAKGEPGCHDRFRPC